MKNKGAFLAEVLTALLIVSLAGTALAYTGTVTKELSYNGITVTLNGERVDLRDAQGNSTEPFIMDDSTYLPIRAISEALGLDVYWDSATKTVNLAKPYTSGSIKNGDTILKTSVERVAPLSVKSASDKGIYVFLVCVDSKGEPSKWSSNYYRCKERCLSFYVAPRQAVDINVPIGEYEIYYAAGETWRDSGMLFGPDTEYYKRNETYTFSRWDSTSWGWTLDLYTKDSPGTAALTNAASIAFLDFPDIRAYQ